MRPPEFIRPLLASPVAILGAGVSGRALTALLAKLGAQAVVYDAAGRDEARPSFTAADAERHQLVLFSPGFAPTHPWLSLARTCGALCLGELDFAALFWRGSIVAITGTNGKTTTTEFLTHALCLAGRDATGTGNIGFPLSQLVVDRGGGGPESVAVCEVSSFQAESLRHFRADSVLWTNFAEDHLERHGDMEHYFSAKWHLLERCIGGHVHVGTSVQRYAAEFGQSLPAEACVATENEPGDLLLQGTLFADYPQRENFLLVSAWWRAAGLRESLLYTAARSFAVARHRMENAHQAGGVTWWNDSKATNFHAAEAAVARFQQPVLIILGGKSKGGDIAAFVRRLAPRVRHAALVGETRHALADACGAAGVGHTVCHNLAEAVHALAALAAPGDDVLLSPGFASLDQFKSYADRGDQFIALARGLTPVASGLSTTTSIS
ncbi:MAG: UDP-N-acetylmuramoyl-L-alanine--D-glutamate ligase [Opitutaceae bacterium]|nr:UDP-N-acetylmuramoyl-L-alanine--D-glutamate ligase [Opitutaceae bacterium]